MAAVVYVVVALIGVFFAAMSLLGLKSDRM